MRRTMLIASALFILLLQAVVVTTVSAASPSQAAIVAAAPANDCVVPADNVVDRVYKGIVADTKNQAVKWASLGGLILAIVFISKRSNTVWLKSILAVMALGVVVLIIAPDALPYAAAKTLCA